MMLRRSLVLSVCGCGLLFGLAWASCAAAFEEKDQPKTEQVKIDDITLIIPADWKQEPPSNRLRKAQFKIDPVKGDKEPAELVVSFFGGDGGGIDPNLIRWLGEFAPDGRKQKLTKGESALGSYFFSDLTGTFNKRAGGPFAGGKVTPVPGTRVLGVILIVPDKGPYFLKLTGPEKTVSAIEDDFRNAFGANAEKEEKYEIKK